MFCILTYLIPFAQSQESPVPHSDSQHSKPSGTGTTGAIIENRSRITATILAVDKPADTPYRLILVVRTAVPVDSTILSFATAEDTLQVYPNMVNESKNTRYLQTQVSRLFHAGDTVEAVVYLQRDGSWLLMNFAKVSR